MLGEETFPMFMTMFVSVNHAITGMIGAEAQGQSWVKEYVSLLHDPAHILLEVTLEALTGLALYPAIRWAVRKHDEHKHGH